jgi:hypothetical protein
MINLKGINLTFMFTKTYNHESGNEELELVVEGRKLFWHAEFANGWQIKELAGLPADAELFLAVEAPFKDEPIANDKEVNLARPEVEHFYVRKKLDFFINGKPIISDRQYILGKQIRKLAGIPEGDQLFLAIPGPWEDERINDNEFIDLARPGKEKFYSQSKIVDYILVVNGREKTWKHEIISYAQVVELAFGPVQEVEQTVYTVLYKKGPSQNPEGSMVKGDTVFVKNKMIFNVTATSRS